MQTSLRSRFLASVVSASMLLMSFATLVTPFTAQAATNLFSDGFESSPNNFLNWTTVDSGWSAVNENHSGSNSAEVKNITSAALQKNISTSGYNSLTLSYWYKIPGVLGSTNHLKVQWSTDGITWNTLVDYAGSATVSNWSSASYNLPVGAENSSGFTFRFLATNLGPSDKFILDDVLLAGTPAPANQTITVTTPAPASAAYGNSFTVAATASSGLGVAISASGSCSGNGTGSATITMSSSSGTCTINYNQAGNSSYNAAPLVTESTSATKKDVSVSATGINKVFDGNTDATVTPTVNGALIGDDVGATYTAAFVSPDVGTGIEVDVSNIALTGVAAGNYHLTNTTTTTSADITASSATIALDAGQNLTPTYNSLAKPLIFSTTPSGLAHSVTYNGSATAPSDAGTYHVVATITDPNYSGSDTETLVIGKANATIHVTSYDVTFDGNAHTAAGTATGIGEDGALSGLDLSGTTHTTIGTYSEDPWTFTDVTGNYHNQSGTVDDAISATPVVTYTLTYTAGSGGTIVGTSPQTAASGTDGTTVTATPNTNFHFVSWSDASTTASRIDTNVTGDINATATFAADEVTPPTPTPTPPSGGGGGGGIVNGPLSYGYVNGGVVLGTSTEATTGGEVLGASTCSTALITEIPLSQGRKNNLGQVKALQGFLNSEMSANLPVNGVFGSMTTLAVKNFQLAHWQEVLAPWTHYGLATDHTATGIVYKTTGRMINNLNCAALNLPQPILP